jgi:hypothetical protein
MSPNPSKPRCYQSELIPLLAVDALPADEQRDVEAHIASCAQCRRELEQFRSVTHALVWWPTDVLRPDPSLWGRVAERISAATGVPRELPASAARLDPEWEDAAPGISYKLLTTDVERGRVSMLVRLAPYVDYPPHMHAEFEELHLLEGELWIDDRKLRPGDFNRAEPGTADRRVWSETGCTCFLTTSFRDVLG